MFSKAFPQEEQLVNIRDDQGFRSRILAYTPEVMMMEWHFFPEGYVIPLHDHYHVQMSYIKKGSARVIFADGSEILARAGDTAAFARGEAHSVITAEPDTEIIDVFAPMRLDHLENHRRPEDSPMQ